MRPWLEIDLAAIVANARRLAARAAPASLCAVVKSNAYGHGMVRVALAIEAASLPNLSLAVFSASEGLALRAVGVSLPILVVGPVAQAELDAAARARLELALLDDTSCEAFARHGIAAHLKIDTGTSRFGISRERAPAALQRCRDLDVKIVGIYSHLANAEDLDTEFTQRQVDALKEVGCINSSAPYYPNAKLHIAASAAAMMWAHTRLDIVRCGIALYGAWPSREVHAFMAGEAPSFELAPALRWYAPVVQVRDLRAGESVGYGRAFVAQRDSRIATLPLGYADGLPRAAGMGKLRVRIAASGAPIVGRVCMNACMLDVTGLERQPVPGDVAEIGIEDVARAASTINYEILAALPAHLERRYL